MGLKMDNIHAPSVASGPTTQPALNGGPKHSSLEELMVKKDHLESELSALGSVLESHGVNMNTSLTTFDGFPRSDIDVAQIRTTRAQIIRLRNDHKTLMTELEVAVQERFAEAAGKSTEDTRRGIPDVGSSSTTTSNNAAIEPPFAKVNTVTPNSPAADAGLRSGDKITRFGTANWTNHDRLAKISQIVQQSENRSITVQILRDGSSTSASQPLQLQLTPNRNWGGRGLLGCHLLPL